MKERTTYEDWLTVTKTNAVAKAMTLATDTCAAVIAGELDCAYLSGPPGVGKSHAVLEAVKSAGLRSIPCNPGNYRDLLADIEQSRKRRQPLFLDEADVIFNSQRMFNVLKKATGTKRERVYDTHIVDVPLGIFVCTNNDLENRSWMDKKLAVHCEAMFSRSTPVVIPSDRLELWEYAVMLAQTQGLISKDERNDGVSIAIANDALDWFTRNVHRLASVSPRTLLKVASYKNRERLGKMKPSLVASMLDAMLTQTDATKPPVSPVIVQRPAARKAVSKRAAMPVVNVKPRGKPEIEEAIGLRPSDPDFMRKWLEKRPG